MVNHPYVVRVSYHNGRPYHIFLDSEMAARRLVEQFEDEINRGKKVFRYTADNSTDEYSLITVLISLDGIRVIATIKKSPELSDTDWLG